MIVVPFLHTCKGYAQCFKATNKNKNEIFNCIRHTRVDKVS